MAINSISNLTDSTVAGSNTEIQYNNSGVFGASSNLTFDGSTLALTGAMTVSSTSTFSGDATFNDNVNATFGTGGDADIYYNGTDLIIDPQVVGSGALIVGSTENSFKGIFKAVKPTDGNYIASFYHTGTSATQYGLYIKWTANTLDDNTHNVFQYDDSTTNRFLIYSDGDVANHDNSYGALSDERVKQDIVDASSQWDDIKNLRVRKYKFISDVEAYGADAVTHIGVIAQEAELVSPGLVHHHLSDAVLDDDGNEVQPAVDQYSVQYSVLYMKCVKALQEAMARIETLEAQVAALQP